MSYSHSLDSMSLYLPNRYCSCVQTKQLTGLVTKWLCYKEFSPKVLPTVPEFCNVWTKMSITITNFPVAEWSEVSHCRPLLLGPTRTMNSSTGTVLEMILLIRKPRSQRFKRCYKKNHPTQVTGLAGYSHIKQPEERQLACTQKDMS